MDYSSDESNTSILKRAEYERKRRHRLKKQKQRKSESEDEIETSPTSTTCQIPNTLHSEPQPVSETDLTEPESEPEVSEPEEAYYDSSSDSATTPSPPTINEDLRDGALKYNIAASTALNDLLRILVSHGNHSLPIDSRSLLNTPRSVQVEQHYVIYSWG